jgi:exopolysaccharide biosynthesis polyprenyl glycosylphosphotransferase
MSGLNDLLGFPPRLRRPAAVALRLRREGVLVDSVDLNANGNAIPAGRRDPDARPRRTGAARLVFLDAVTLALAAVAAVSIHPARGPHSVGWALGYCLATFVILHVRGFYSFRLGGSILPDVGRIATATALAVMMLLTARVVLGDNLQEVALAARLWVYSTVFLAAGRGGLALGVRRSWVQSDAGLATLVVGAGRVGRLVARRLRDRPEFGLRPVGHIDDEPLPGGDDDLPMLGGTRDLERVVAANGVRHVLITFARESDERLLALMHRCRLLGVEVAVVPRLYEEMTHRMTIEHVGGLPLIRVEQPDPRGWQFAVKYAADRVIAATVLLLMLPLVLLIAALVRLSSPGPVFFRQVRVARDGHEFPMLKFRTMRGDPMMDGEADAGWAAGLRGEVVAPGAVVEDRTTALGRLLRKTSLDELPQLINVLTGDMSLVGPRPERVGYVREFEGLIYRYADRHRVKSGLTGWAQVQGLRGETSLADRVEWDNHYIENWTLALDLKIMLMTLPAMLTRERRPTEAPPHAESPRASTDRHQRRVHAPGRDRSARETHDASPTRSTT